MGDSGAISARRRPAGVEESGVIFVDVPSDLIQIAANRLVLLLSLRPWASNLPLLVSELVKRRAAGLVLQDGSTAPPLRAELIELATRHGLPVYGIPPEARLGDALDELYANRERFLVNGAPDPRAIQQAESLSALADALSRQLIRSVTIEDREFGILAYSAQDLNVDQARINSILRKHVPTEVITALRKHGIPNKLRTTSKPLRVRPIPEAGLGHRLVMPLRLGEELLGHIWIIDPQNTLADGVTELLEQAAARAVQLLQRDQQAVRNRRVLIENFLHDLFQGRFPTEESAVLQSRMLGLGPAPARVALVMAQEESAAAVSLLQALEAASARYPGEVIACEAGSAVWALCACPAEGGEQSLRQQVGQLVRETLTLCPQLSVGVGQPASSLLEARTSFDSATIALRWGACLQRPPRITFSEDLGALRLIQLPALSGNSCPSSRALQQLSDYDQRKGTDLLHSLEVFLDEAGNVRRAAGRLHVHPNSLLYRLQRIQEVTRLDLDSGPVRLMLHLELKVQSLCRAEEAILPQPGRRGGGGTGAAVR